jgi:hypothetical protein
MFKQSRAVTALWLLTIAFCVSLVLDLIPLLRGDMPGLTTQFDWVWTYDLPRWGWVIPCILGLAIYVIGALYLLEYEPESKYPLRLILWAFVGAALIPILLMTLEGQPLFLLFTRSASYLTGGYQESAAMISDVGSTLRQWPQFMANYRVSIHNVGGLALSPPGIPALYYVSGKILDAVPALTHPLAMLLRPLECQNEGIMGWTDGQLASAWIQMAMPLWAALAVAPLYRLANTLFNRQTARWAVVLWPLLPTIDMFTPRFNSFYPLITLLLLLALWRGLDRNSILWIAVAGFITSVGIFLNLTLTPLGLLAGLTIIGHAWMTKSGVVKLIRNLVVYGIGSASIWVIYWLLTGISPLAVIQLGMAFNAQILRPYLPWLLMHPYDMFLFVGLPIAALSLWRIVRTRKLDNRADVFAVVSGLTLLILVLSGTARGETGRVWSFFAPLWIVLAANLWQRLRQNERVTLFGVQALYLLCIAAVLHVNFTSLTVPVTATTADHAAGFPIKAKFVHGQDAITLVGFDFDQSPNTLTLHLHWRADSFVSRPYYLSLVTIPPDRSYRPGYTWYPLDKAYPPSCWRPGQEFIDDVAVSLGDKPQTGGWLFSIAITDFWAKQPMDVVGDTTAQVGIGPIQVKAK